MSRFRRFCAALVAIAVGLAAGAGFGSGSQCAFAADLEQKDTLRPAVGKPLQQAQTLLAAQRYPQALAKIRQADAVKNKTRYEALIIEELRGFAEKGAGDTTAAIKSFQAIIAAGQLPAVDQARFTQEIALEYYNAKDYPDAIQWAARVLKLGGNATETHTLLAQSYYLTGDYASAARELRAQIGTAAGANRPPPENQLVMLADCALKQKDDADYIADLKQLVLFYPKKDYWVPLLHQVERKPGFAGRLQLDLDRLKLATGTLNTADDYLEMTQLALVDGLPGEAEKTIEQGYSAGILGAGPGADRQKRLRDMAVKSVAEDEAALPQTVSEASGERDGTGLVNTGLDYVGYGRIDEGFALIEQGIRKGGLKHLEDTKLRLGVAYLLTGHKVKAVEILQTVRGDDGTGDLARLWIIYARPHG